MSDTAEAPARFATCLVAVDIDLAQKSTIFWSPGRKTMRDNEESTCEKLSSNRTGVELCRHGNR